MECLNNTEMPSSKPKTCDISDAEKKRQRKKKIQTCQKFILWLFSWSSYFHIHIIFFVCYFVTFFHFYFLVCLYVLLWTIECYTCYLRKCLLANLMVGIKNARVEKTHTHTKNNNNKNQIQTNLSVFLTFMLCVCVWRKR